MERLSVPPQNSSIFADEIMRQRLPDGTDINEVIAAHRPGPDAHRDMLAEAAQMQPTGDPLADALIGRLVEYALTGDPAAVLDPHEMPPTVPDTLPPAAEM